jgi:hypothetical protein
MGRAGASTARDGRRSRAWVDFGVDESWEPAPRRRRLEAAPPADVMVADSEPADVVAADAFAGDTFAANTFATDGFAADYEPDPSEYLAIAQARYGTAGDRGGYAPRDSASYSAPPTALDDAVPPGRRTVTIRGRGAERELAFPTYRSANRPATRRRERPGYKPDRTAMWAVLLGVLLVLVAAASSHAAVLSHHDAALLAQHHVAASHHAALVVSARTR